MKRFAIALCVVAMSSTAWAQLETGTWIKRPSSTPPMMMVIEPAGIGVRVIYRMLGPNGNPLDQMALTFVTTFDGNDAPMTVDGKDTGQSMAIRRIDRRHTVSVIKFQGKQVGTSRSELSSDGRTLTIESDMSASNPGAGKITEYWDRN
jgi:hypothetical protein